MLNPSAYQDSETGQPKVQQPANPDCLVMVENFPETHTADMITKICEVFGQVIHVDMGRDPNTGNFTGTVTVQYNAPVDAKRALHGMTGLKVEDSILLTKKAGSLPFIGDDPNAGNACEDEVFQALIEDRPTACLCLKNIV